MKMFRLTCLWLGCSFALVVILTQPPSLRAPRNTSRATPPTKQAVTPADRSARAQINERYGKLPLSFEANRGQAGDKAQFLARGNGYQLALTATEAALALQHEQRQAVVRMKLVGADPAAQMDGREELQGKSNYFLGNDPTRWRTDVPNYARVEARQVWPGVDLVYYGRQRQLEYDFVVAPGADPRPIRLAFDGVEKLELDAQGNLALRVADGDVVLRKPFVYQEVGGARQEIASCYVLAGKQVSFEMGAYDARRPLIIDPILSYSTYLGGSFSDRGYGIAVDAAGNAYVTGEAHSANFPLANALDPTNTARERSAFVTKLNPAGTALVYSTYLGGSERDSGDDIVVDAAGNVWLAGYTYSTDFPTKNPLQAMLGSSDGSSDVFIAKLNPTGSELVYSTFLGGSESDGGQGIAMDVAGAIYVTGYTRSLNFPTLNPVQANNAGSGFADAFILKLNPAGSALVYSTYLGGSSGDEGQDIAVDSAGAAYVTGETFSTNFRTVNPLQPAHGGGSSDGFVAHLNSAGSALVYSTYLGGNSGDEGNGIAVDAFGAAYVTGRTDSPNFPTKEPFQAMYRGQTDAFVTVLAATGTLVYSTFLGGSNSDYGRAIALDSSGNVHVTGGTDSTNFPLVNPIQATLGNGSGGYDAFVTKFNSIGSALLFSTYFGGSSGGSSDEGNAIALDSVGNVYITGETSATNLPTKTPVQATLGGVSDGFVAKISEISIPPTPTPTPTATPTPTPTPTPSPATVRVEGARKTCTPSDAYPRIAAQAVAGPNFAAIPEQAPTQIVCSFEAEVVLDGISGNTGPVTLTIFDGFSPGLFFNQLTASSPSLTVASYTNNLLTFNPITLQLPPQTALQRFRISFAYLAFLNDLAEQRNPQQNCITLRFNDAVTGRQLLESGPYCADIQPLVPRLTLEKYGSPTTGLPGDTLKFTVLARNGGNIFLQTVEIDALIPNNTTLVPGSVAPPPTRIIGNRIEWRGLGPLNAGGALPVSYDVTIDERTPENAKLIDQAFAQATTPNFASAGTRRLNAASNLVTVMVMGVRTGIELALTPAPRAGCPLTLINYTATITNTGQVTLDRVRFNLTQATENVEGNPTYPLELDPLGPGETRTLTYKGRIGLRQKGALVDVATVIGRPVNNGVPIADLVGDAATALVQVSPPAVSKITPASAPAGSSNLELKIEGACFVPQTVVSFSSGSGITVIDPTPPDFGFVGTSELRRFVNIAANAAPGERELLVTNPSGDSGGLRPFNVFTVTGAPAAIEASATSLDFANVPTGQSRDLTLTVRNTGTGLLTLNPIASDNPRFSIVSPALPLVIVPGGQQAIIVRFTPNAAGPQNGALTIPSNAANRPSLSIALSGAGLGIPDITVGPDLLEFGSVAPGQTASRSLTISNPGTGALNLYAITSSDPAFSVALPFAPVSIPAGGAFALSATFAPTAVGAQTGTLLIASSAVDKNIVAVQARGETPGGGTLATDDGTAEMGALQDGLLIVNRLTPPRYPVTLRSLRIFFAQFQNLPSPVGEQIRLVAFADPAGTGQPPANPQLIVNQTVTIPAFPANGGFVDFPITAANFAATEEDARALTIESGDLYVGFQAPRPARGVVFAADANGPQQQRAFFSTNDGASYAKLTGLENPGGSVTPVNIMTQAGIGGVGVCSYTINPGSGVFAEAGGGGTVMVTAPAGCAWTVSSTIPWITFNPNSGGAGNGTAGFTVAAGAMPRQANVTIAGQPFTVAQAERVASVSSASFQRLGLAGEAIAAAFGPSLAPTTQLAATIPLPTTLAGTTVKVRDAAGTELFAPLFFVSPNQVNFLMPPGLVPGTATVTISNGNTASVGAVLNDAVAPGLFAADASGQGLAAALALRVRADGSLSYEPIVRFDPAQNKLVAVPIELGPASDQVFLLLFGTGWRKRTALSGVSIKIGGTDAPVLYAGSQGDFVGLDQINVGVPRSLAGRGEVDLLLTVDGRAANLVRVNVK